MRENYYTSLIYCFYSASDKDKSLEFESSFPEGVSSIKTKALIKTIILLCATLTLFGFIFFAMTGWVMVFENYDRVFIATYILQNVIDFILFEVIVSIFVALLASSDQNAEGCFLNVLTTFTKWRCGA